MIRAALVTSVTDLERRLAATENNVERSTHKEE